jgi:large subunit ribosomal protein L24
MKQKWSPSWSSSVQPRKQRKFRINAPLHVRRRLVSANLSPVLRNQYGKRSMPIRKGDEVEVMRGGFRKFKGLVDTVDLKKGRIYLEGVKIKKVDGSEVMRALQPSNLRITKLNLDDKRRQSALERSSPKKPVKAKEKAKPEEKPAKATEKAEKPREKPREAPKAPEKKGEPARKEEVQGGKALEKEKVS